MTAQQPSPDITDRRECGDIGDVNLIAVFSGDPALFGAAVQPSACDLTTLPASLGRIWLAVSVADGGINAR